MKPLGESRSQAVRRFLSLEKSLKHSHQTEAFRASMEEYFDCGHAEMVPLSDLDKPTNEVFYLPMHIVHKESSSTTKIRIVFDASAKSSTGVSLNDVLVVGPTVHPSLRMCCSGSDSTVLHLLLMSVECTELCHCLTLTEIYTDLFGERAQMPHCKITV